MLDWSNFFVAAASSAAALTGLIFVGVSINLRKILEIKGLPERALISLILLLTILVLSLLLLIPGQLATAQGIEILGISFVSWLFVVYIDWKTVNKKDLSYRRYYLTNMIFNQVSLIPYFIGGLDILCTDTNIGYPPATVGYWIVAAFIISFVKAVAASWIFLIEIHR